MIILWRFLAPAAALLVIAGSIWWAAHTIKTLRITAATLRVELADLMETAVANAAAAERIREVAERNLLAVSASLEEARATRLRLEKQRKELRNVPVADAENVMSAVLTAALVCLRNPATCADAGTGSGGGGPGAADGDGIHADSPR